MLMLFHPPLTCGRNMQVVLLVGRRAGETVSMPFDRAVANVANGTAAWVAPEAVAEQHRFSDAHREPVPEQAREPSPAPEQVQAPARRRGRPRLTVPA